MQYQISFYSHKNIYHNSIFLIPSYKYAARQKKQHYPKLFHSVHKMYHMNRNLSKLNIYSSLSRTGPKASYITQILRSKNKQIACLSLTYCVKVDYHWAWEKRVLGGLASCKKCLQDVMSSVRLCITVRILQSKFDL